MPLDDVGINPLSGGFGVQLITGGALNKVGYVTFHSTLPWIALAPKHGSWCAIWDYSTHRIIADFHVQGLLSVQLPDLIPSKEWTEELVGQIQNLFFFDQGHLSWLHYEGRAQKYEPACNAPSNFGIVGPRHSSGGSEKPAADLGSLAPALASTMRVDDAVKQEDTSGKDELHLCIVTTTMAVVVSATTSTIVGVCPGQQFQNREITSSLLITVPQPGRAYPCPFCLFGCSDGNIIVWDGDTRNTGCVVDINSFATQSELIRVVPTPHSSAITAMCLHVYADIRPRKGKHAAIDAENNAPQYFVSVTIGTKGGSVTHVALFGVPENLTQAVGSDLKPLPRHVLFAKKKVHDLVLSIAETQLSPSLQWSASERYASGENPEELIHTIAAIRNVYSLGPAAVVMLNGRTGIELRRLLHAKLFKDPIALCATHFQLLVLTAGDEQWALDFDVTAESKEKWFSISDHVSLASKKEKDERRVRSIYAVDHIGKVPPSQESIGTADLTVYRIEVHAVRSNAMFGIACNEGCVIIDQRPSSSTRVALPGAVGQASFSFGQVEMSPSKDKKEKTEKEVCPFLQTQQAFVLTSKPGRTELLIRSVKSRVSRVLYVEQPDVARPTFSRYLTPLTHLVCPGAVDASSDSTPKNISDTFETEVRTVIEPSPTFTLLMVLLSPLRDLVSAVTTAKDVVILDIEQDFTVLPVPSSLKIADDFSWSSDGRTFAVLNIETGRILVGSVQQQKGIAAFAVSVQTHEIHPSNPPVGITGGRWLCVHYEAAFSGLSSQFYRWDSAARGGGGAVGGFLPQPLLLQWDNTATLCALAYTASICFMATQRKVFSLLASTDLRSEPQHIFFHFKSLFVVLAREIVLLLPTKSGVHKILVASVNTVAVSRTPPAPASGLQISADEDNEESTKSGPSATFSPTVRTRPPGTLQVIGVDEESLTVFVADELLRIAALHYHGTLAHLLSVLHRGALHFDTAVSMLQAYAKVQLRGGGTSSLTLEAVEAFAADCGCAEVVAVAKEKMRSKSLARAGPVSPKASSNADSADSAQNILAPVESLLKLCLHNIAEIAVSTGEGRISPQHAKAIGDMKRAVEVRLRDVFNGLTANGWHLSTDTAYYRQCANGLLTLANGIVQVGAGNEGSAVPLWQGEFLREIALEMFVAGNGCGSH